MLFLIEIYILKKIHIGWVGRPLRHPSTYALDSLLAQHLYRDSPYLFPRLYSVSPCSNHYCSNLILEQ